MIDRSEPMEDLVELEARARESLEPMAFAYLAGGADDELTVTDNIAAWRRRRLRPRVLRDVAAVDVSTTVLGLPVALPVLVAPTAMHHLFCSEGEVASARAAGRVGTVMTVSMSASTSVEDIAAAAPDTPLWFQLYMQRDRALTRDLCARVADAGVRGLVVTVDSPVLSRRKTAATFRLPDGMRLPHLERPSTAGPDLFGAVAEFDASVTFDDLAHFKDWSRGLPVVVKGVLRGDDARRCVDAGADAVAVSNHGGRQLDEVVATADALPEVVDAVGGDAEVFVDGGIRKGTDVVKALAMGANAVLVGRPVVWGLAVEGEDGASSVLAGFAAGLARAMAFCGASRVDELATDLVV